MNHSGNHERINPPFERVVLEGVRILKSCHNSPGHYVCNITFSLILVLISVCYCMDICPLKTRLQDHQPLSHRPLNRK